MAPVIKQTPLPSTSDTGSCFDFAAWDPGFGTVSIVGAIFGLAPAIFVAYQVYRSSCWRTPRAKLSACQAIPLLAIAFTFPLSCAFAGSSGQFGAFGSGRWGDRGPSSLAYSAGTMSALHSGMEMPNPRFLVVHAHAALLVLGLACWTSYYSPDVFQSFRPAITPVLPPPPPKKSRRSRATSSLGASTSGEAASSADAAAASPLDYSAPGHIAPLLGE